MTTFVSICISTYKRPQGLKTLLDRIGKLEFHQLPTPTLEVIVIDNDKAESARSIYEQVAPQFPWHLVYDVEPQQGVTHARNRSVAKTADQSEFIVFIDDDEFPEPGWIEALLATQQTYGADVVMGPVYPQFEAEEVPGWIQKGRFFAPPDRETGTILEIAHTNNVLVKSACLRQFEVVFDNGRAFQGTEDSHLFMRLAKMGVKIVWSREAAVHEVIPESRTQLKWLLARNYYGWSSHSLLEREFYPALTVQATRFVKGLILLLMGFLGTLPSLLMGKHRVAQSLIYLYRGLGTLSGLVGKQGSWGGANR